MDDVLFLFRGQRPMLCPRGMRHHSRANPRCYYNEPEGINLPYRTVPSRNEAPINSTPFHYEDHRRRTTILDSLLSDRDNEAPSRT